MITLVSGLPRSGTSVMMNMLQKGGLEILCDGIRTPDLDNPYEYFEFEKVKTLKKDSSWLYMAEGRVVKIISQHLKYLPSKYRYKVIFMKRDLREVLLSQKKMMERNNYYVDEKLEDRIFTTFKNHLAEIYNWLEKQANFDVFFVNYIDVLKQTTKISLEVSNFLKINLDSQAMVNVVVHSLYHNRIQEIA